MVVFPTPPFGEQTQINGMKRSFLTAISTAGFFQRRALSLRLWAQKAARNSRVRRRRAQRVREPASTLASAQVRLPGSMPQGQAQMPGQRAA